MRRFLPLLLIVAVTSSLFGAAPATRPFNLDTATAGELIAAIVEATGEGSSPSRYIQPAVDRGMAAAVACEPFLGRDSKTDDALFEVIASVGKSRRSHPELLRLYDPAAYRIFCTPDGEAEQNRLAGAIDAEVWPAHYAEAMQRAAPLPALRWMEQQATSSSPRLEHLRQLWQHWGWWIRTGNEHQHSDGVRRVTATLAANRAIVSDTPTLAAPLRFAGESNSAEATEFVIANLRTAGADSRGEAAIALGRLTAKGLDPQLAGRALEALVDASAKESNAVVLSKLAEAAESWPAAAPAGQAMLDLFSRTNDASVRRAILFSAAETTWPQRSKLILRAFDVPDDGVLGIALQAIAMHPSPEFVEPTLSLLRTMKSPDPNVIDAVGSLADVRAAPQLVTWLKDERNPSARLKTALALEKFSDDASRSALLDLLGREDNAMVMDHLVTIAGRIGLKGSEPVLIALAEDKTAPLSARVSAVWSLGHFDTPAVRDALHRWSDHPEQFFTDPLDTQLAAGQYERLEQVRMYVALARLRLGEVDAERQVQPLYDRSTPTARLAMLVMLAELKRDHPVIAEGLESGDLAVLLATVKAAGAVDARKYHAQLVALRDGPFVSALMKSSLDALNFKTVLNAAVTAGGSEMLKESR